MLYRRAVAGLFQSGLSVSVTATAGLTGFFLDNIPKPGHPPALVQGNIVCTEPCGAGLHEREPFLWRTHPGVRFLRGTALYAKPAQRMLVLGEQALCDFAWLNLRDGIEPQSLVTFRNVASLNHRRLSQVLRRYPGKVQQSVGRITGIATRTPLSA